MTPVAKRDVKESRDTRVHAVIENFASELIKEPAVPCLEPIASCVKKKNADEEEPYAHRLPPRRADVSCRAAEKRRGLARRARLRATAGDAPLAGPNGQVEVEGRVRRTTARTGCCVHEGRRT